MIQTISAYDKYRHTLVNTSNIACL